MKNREIIDLQPTDVRLIAQAEIAKLAYKSAEDLLVVGPVVIHRSDNGLFNINDLHKASGANQSKRPPNYMRTAEAKRVIARLEAKHGPGVHETVVGGDAPGTYVHKHLAYAYATWLDDEYMLLALEILDEATNKIVNGVQSAFQILADKYGEVYALNHSSSEKLAKAHKENQDSMLIIRTMEQSVSRLRGNVPKSVADYFGLQKRNLVEASLALENAHGTILSVYEDAHSIIHGVKVKLTQDISKHWRDFLTNDLLNPLQDMASHLNTKLGEVSEDLTRAREYRVGGSKHFGKQES